jgi:hypothetical protein
MKRLYRLKISGWYPVELDEKDAAEMTRGELHALYKEIEVNPYDFDDLVLTLEASTPADQAKYGDPDDDAGVV